MEVAAKEVEEEEVEKGGGGRHSLGEEGSGHHSLGEGGSGHLRVERRGERADELRRRRVALGAVAREGLGREVVDLRKHAAHQRRVELDGHDAQWLRGERRAAPHVVHLVRG